MGPEEERIGVAEEPAVSYVVGKIERARLPDAALEGEHRIVGGEHDAVLAVLRMKWSRDSGRYLGDHAEVMSRRFRYLIISRVAMSHHGSAPWIIDSLSSGNRSHTRSMSIGFCGSAGNGGPGMPVFMHSGSSSSQHFTYSGKYTASVGGYMPSPQKLGPTEA